MKLKLAFVMLIIAGSAMLIGGLILLLLDLTTAESSSLRSIVLFSVEAIEQTAGFPLPTYEFVNNSISAVGLAALTVGLDLLLLSIGLLVRSRMALWIAMIIFTLAAFFDFTTFLLEGVIGAPLSPIGTLINGLVVGVLMKNRKWFTTEFGATGQSHKTRRKSWLARSV
ncbi:MAG TPA: hypothetical protein VMT26_01345 [Candidatus Bathyarchaeia archaeon]|nr:hypothetical protein [Candidatus Bathyarchaeia archaeon]